MICKAIVAAWSLAVLCGCAQRPQDIQASYVSPITYQALTCPQIAAEQARVDQALVTASKQQSDARTNDTAGVLLIGLPVGSMGGQNIAPQIAQLKGEKETLNHQAIQANCAGVVPQTAPAPSKQPATAQASGPGKMLVAPGKSP